MWSLHGQRLWLPGEWRCLKAAVVVDGNFKEPSQVVAFVRCEGPGRTIMPNIGMAMKLLEIKPDVQKAL